MYFGNNAQYKLIIIGKSGLRYYQDCIQEIDKQAKKDKKRYHFWAAAGLNFKFDIYFYKLSGNTSGKMIQRMHIDQIL